MLRRLALFGLTSVLLTSHLAIAQQRARLPDVVQQRIDDETLLVARIALDRDVSSIGRLSEQLPDPSGLIGKRGANLDTAIKKLTTLKVKEAYILASSSNLPMNGATIIVPAAGADADRAAILDALKSVWPDHTEAVNGGVVVTDGQQRPLQARKSDNRPEFAAALNSVNQSAIQVAFSLGSDTRRVVREGIPTLPPEVGGGSAAPIADGWQWLSLGVNLAPKFDLQLTIQASDDKSAEALERIANAAVKTAVESKEVSSVIPNARVFLPMLTLKRTTNRLQLVLNEANGAGKLTEEVGAPLLNKIDASSRRTNSINNLKQLMLAMHNYHDAFKAFPAQAITAKDGKKFLSWRVALLPYLGEGELHNQFHLDEPWDSEHNKQLITKMPEVFGSMNSTREQRTKGMTTYEGLVAEKTLFGSDEGIAIRKITDGTSNTIAIVDANSDKAVIWTQPADLEVDLKQPVKGLQGQVDGRFIVGMCDGSVRTISDTIAAQILRTLFQINDGEVVGDF